mgnify:CR=1 FL=1
MSEVLSTDVLAQVETEKYPNGSCLAFRKIRCEYENGEIETGYTFVWIKADGTITPRGCQVMLPNENYY